MNQSAAIRLCRNCKLFETDDSAIAGVFGSAILVTACLWSQLRVARVADMHIGILEDDSTPQEFYKLWLGSFQRTCERHSSALDFVAALRHRHLDLQLID